MEGDMQENVLDNDKTKKNAGLIAGISVAAVVVVIAVIAVLAIVFGGKSADTKAQKAFKNMSEEFLEYTTAIDEIKFDELSGYAAENPMHAYLDLSVTLPESENLSNVSLELDCTSDLKNRAWDAEVEAGTYGISVNIGNLIYSDKDLYLQSRFLGDDTYKIAFENFVVDFNKSAWSKLLGTQIPEDEFEAYTELKSVDYESYKKSVTELLKGAVKNFEYSSIKEKKELEVDGNTIKCTGIEVVLSKEYADNVIDELIDGFGGTYSAYRVLEDNFAETLEKLKTTEIADDLIFDIYIDSKGRIVNMSTPRDIEFTSNLEEGYIEAVSFDLNFVGSKRRADVIEGDIYIKADGEIACINVDRNASVNDEEYDEDVVFTVTSDGNEDTYSVRYTDTWNKQEKSFDMAVSMDENGKEGYSLSANGSFEDIIEGKAYTLEVKNAMLSVNGGNMVIVSGKYTYEPSNDTIEAPSNSIDVLKMTETEIENTFYSVLGNIYSGLN